MKRSLTDFAGRLRKTGLNVSSAELIDASEMLSHIGLEDRSVFKDGLRSTLIKRERDIPVFDELFDLHFAGRPIAGAAPEETEARALDALAERLEEMPEVGESDISPVTEMIVTGRLGALNRLLHSLNQQLGIDRMEIAPLRGNVFVHRLRRAMNLDQVKAETERLLSEMGDRGLTREQIQAMRDYVGRNLERVENELETLVRAEVAKSRFLALRRIDDEQLARLNLFQLSEEDILAMRPAVDRLARRLKDRLSLRLKWADKGRFDLKNTLRKNIGLGGPLPDLRFRNKKPARPQVLALCDVSRSVRNFSRFMLLFLYTLKEVIPRVKSFIFVGDLAEVTRLFQRHDLNEAVSLAAAGHGLTYPVGTDYGNSLSQFANEHLTEVNSKTTVIMLGDARNNYFEPRTETLEAIAGRARKLIWLNPEPQAFWSVGDSVMDLYCPYCTTVAQCGNLEELSDVIEESLIP